MIRWAVNVAALKRAVADAASMIGCQDPADFDALREDNKAARRSILGIEHMRRTLRAMQRCPGLDQTDQVTGKTFRQLLAEGIR